MKHAALFALVLTSCMTSPQSAPEPESDPAPAAGPAHPDLVLCPDLSVDHLNSENWTFSNGIADLWPNNCGITKMQMLVRKGPTDPFTGHNTIIAYVVWNDSTVGRIFTADWDNNGDGTGLDLKQQLENTLQTRQQVGLPNHWGGGGGGPDSGTPPMPHPHVDGTWNVHFNSVDNARNASAAMTNAQQLAAGL